MASKIEDYGIIGDMKTAALVSKSGSVDWLCMPSFDSDACFASLLGYDNHGRWSIRPTVPVSHVNQHYRGETLVLETELTCEGGVVRLVEFMPVLPSRSDVVRIVEGVSGDVAIEMIFDARFGYGADLPYVEATDDGVQLIAGADSLRLRGGVKPAVNGPHLAAHFRVRAGERIGFQLAWHASHEPAPPALDVEAELGRTEKRWRDWSARCTYRGRYRDAVVRSLLALKALTCEETGAVVAAATTSLPERLGGVRNWDYRFCWLRDATLTLRSLMFGGYVNESRAFTDWLMRAAAGDPEQVQIMYDIYGRRRLTETELTWLPGYEGSSPVRIGNAAADQFQLDVFGEVLSCFYQAVRMGLPADAKLWGLVRALLQHVDRVWQHPGNGVWEVRGAPQQFTYAKVMAWAAIDCGMKLIEEFGLGGSEGTLFLPHLHSLRARIHAEVCERGYHPTIGAFTQAYGSEALDASVLRIPNVGFLPATDPRMRSTVEAIEKKLLRGGFVLRYETSETADGLPPAPEGVFLACSFWLATNYALTGRTAEAEALFDRLLGLRNHLGLLSEEYDPATRRLIGNFPQAFSHLALISTAQDLEEAAAAGERGRRAEKPKRGAA